MDEAYIGSIVLFAGNFAPRGWNFCDGSILSIAQNSALFAILGTTYGGNGVQTFALPDLRSRVPVHANNGQAGPGQPAVQLGQAAGTANVTLTSAQMPMHTHTQLVGTQSATTNTAGAGVLLGTPNGTTDSGDTVAINNLVATGGGVATLAPTSIGVAGGSQPVSVMQPYLGLNYIICLQGIFPSRN